MGQKGKLRFMLKIRLIQFICLGLQYVTYFQLICSNTLLIVEIHLFLTFNTLNEEFTHKKATTFSGFLFTIKKFITPFQEYFLQLSIRHQ